MSGFVVLFCPPMPKERKELDPEFVQDFLPGSDFNQSWRTWHPQGEPLQPLYRIGIMNKFHLHFWYLCNRSKLSFLPKPDYTDSIISSVKAATSPWQTISTPTTFILNKWMISKLEHADHSVFWFFLTIWQELPSVACCRIKFPFQPRFLTMTIIMNDERSS